MPFDSAPENETVRILRAAKARIADPKDWCIKKVVQHVDGREQRCALGALWAADPKATAYGGPWRALQNAAAERGYGCFAAANNKIGHDGVMRMFDRAIELAQQDALADSPK